MSVERQQVRDFRTPGGTVHVLPDAEGVGRYAASRFVEFLAGMTRGRGPVGVALAGGRTPAAMYRALRELEMLRELPWSSVKFAFGDERAVTPDHPDSNYGLALRELFDHLPAPPAAVLRMEGEQDDLEVAAEDYEQALRREFPLTYTGVPHLDLIFLGMGADGHTASLFPGTEALREPNLVVTTGEAPDGSPRLTLTFSGINAAREAWFLVAGEEKAATLASVLAGKLSYPAACVRPSGGFPVWIVDEAAASKVEV